MKKIAVLIIPVKEDTEKYYFDISDPYMLAASVRAMVNILQERGCLKVHSIAPVPDLSRVEADSLPEGSVRKLAQSQWELYDLSVKQNREDADRLMRIKSMISSGQYQELFKLLLNRQQLLGTYSLRSEEIYDV